MFEQERVLVRLQQKVLGEKKMLACFLSGSYGRFQEDGYSDLDVTLIYADDFSRETAWQSRIEFVRSVTPYVPAKSFDTEHLRPYLHSTLYSNGTKADYQFESATQLQPTPWHRDIRILKDTDNWAKQYHDSCMSMIIPQARISSAELKAIDNRFWITYWDVLRRILRGDNDKPFPVYLQLLHFTLPPLLHTLPPEEPARAPLQVALFNPDTQVTAVHLKTLLTAYLAARTAVIQRLHLDFQIDTRFETDMQRIVNNKI